MPLRQSERQVTAQRATETDIGPFFVPMLLGKGLCSLLGGCCVCGRQLWYTRRPGDDDVLRGRAYSTCEVQDSAAGATPAVAGGVEASKLATSLNLNGDVDIGEINLSEMNPEDIRVSESSCL